MLKIDHIDSKYSDNEDDEHSKSILSNSKVYGDLSNSKPPQYQGSDQKRIRKSSTVQHEDISTIKSGNKHKVHFGNIMNSFESHQPVKLHSFQQRHSLKHFDIKEKKDKPKRLNFGNNQLLTDRNNNIQVPTFKIKKYSEHDTEDIYSPSFASPKIHFNFNSTGLDSFGPSSREIK